MPLEMAGAAYAQSNLSERSDENITESEDGTSEEQEVLELGQSGKSGRRR